MFFFPLLYVNAHPQNQANPIIYVDLTRGGNMPVPLEHYHIVEPTEADLIRLVQETVEYFASIERSCMHLNHRQQWLNESLVIVQNDAVSFG